MVPEKGVLKKETEQFSQKEKMHPHFQREGLDPGENWEWIGSEMGVCGPGGESPMYNCVVLFSSSKIK